MSAPREHSLVRRVRTFIEPLDGVSGGIVVAVSGGADSVALLRALAGLAGRVVVAHLNHQLRGGESDADEAFVRELAEALRKGRRDPLDWRCKRMEIAAHATKERGNLEAIARRLRYAWLDEVARAEGIQFVATGHTANDQSETVLHRIMRGTGTKGLRGIAARRRLSPSVELIRPILGERRMSVTEYLQELDQPFRMDSSNLNVGFTRNRIRHELIPLLERQFNPAIVDVLCRLANEAQAIHARQSKAAELVLKKCEHSRAGSLIVLDHCVLAAESRPKVREVFRLIWDREQWPVGRMDFKSWDRLAGLVFGEHVAVDLPDGVRARCQARVIQLRRDL